MITKEEARTKLRELGFTVADDDADLATMVAIFQRSYGLPMNGDIDEATSAKIVEVHAIEVPPADV